MIEHTRERRILRSYQKTGVDFLDNTQHAALFWEMRLGKTLTVVRSIKRESRLLPALIVGPYSVLHSWRVELLNESIPESEIAFLTGTKEQRIETLNKNLHCFYLINKEGFLVVPELYTFPFRTIILDESPFIKSPTSKASKYFVQHFRNAQKRIILTGTPAPEGELDLFQQLRFLDYSILPFDNFWHFKKECFGEGFKHSWILLEKGKQLLSQRMATCCSFLTRKDVKIGGQKIYMQRMIEKTEKFSRTYQRAEKDYILEHDDSICAATDYKISAYTWLRELCGGFIQDDFVFENKLKELIYLVRYELCHQQIVIWCAFTNEILKIKSAMRDLETDCSVVYGEIDQEKRIEELIRFTSGHTRLFIAQPKCFQYGIDLSCAPTAIYYTSPLDRQTREQSEDRVINAKEDNKMIIDLIVEDSIEQSIYTSHIRKETREQQLKRIVDDMQQRTNRNVRSK